MSTINYINNIEQISNVINWINQHKILAVDTETTSLDPLKSKVLLLQIGTEARQYVINTFKIGDEGVKTILNALNTPNIIKVLHNAVFDYQHIKSNYGISLNNMRCTMIGEQLLNQGKNISASLAAVANKYLNLNMEKDVRDTFSEHIYGVEFTKEQIEYAAIDVTYLLTIYNKINNLIVERDMIDLANLEYRVIKVLGDMSLNGIYIDKDKWLDLESSAVKAVEEAEKQLNEHFKEIVEKNSILDLFGRNSFKINFDSPKQVLPALIKVTGYNFTSTDAKYLDYYKDQYDVIKDLINYRQQQKKITTYGSSFLEYVASDGKIHSNFKQLRAQTGRISSDNPNMTNIPKSQDYRTPFCVHDPDWDFISADFSGQELRLLAQLSKEPEYIKALTEKIDLHTYSASLLFDKPYDSITIEERKQCKSITFGLLYGAGPKKLSTQLKISFEEAKVLMNKYFKVFPKVKVLMDNLVKDAKKNKYALSPLDKRRIYFNIDWDNMKQVSHTMNQTKNFPFQGCGASTTKRALIYIDEKIQERNLQAQIVNSIHDEILVICHSTHTEETKSIVETEMIRAFNYYAPDVPMEVSLSVGKHWIH